MENNYQINLQKLDWQKATLISIIVILIFCLFTCKGSTPITAENKSLEKEKSKVKVIIKNHYDTITKIETKIKQSIVYRDIKIDSVSTLNTQGIANYYQDRYNVTDEVTVSEKGVVLKDTVAILNIVELVKYDHAKEVIIYKDEIIENHLFIEAQQDTIINIVEMQKKAVDKQNKELTTAIKKERRKTTFYQIALAVVGVIATVEALQK